MSKHKVLLSGLLSLVLLSPALPSAAQNKEALRAIDPIQASYDSAPAPPPPPAPVSSQPTNPFGSGIQGQPLGASRRTLQNPNPPGSSYLPYYTQPPGYGPAPAAPGWNRPGASGDSGAYERRVQRLEQMTFGSPYPEHEIEDRLDHLENEIFSKKNSAMPTDQRLARLESKLLGQTAFEQSAPPGYYPPNQPTVTSGQAPYQQYVPQQGYPARPLSQQSMHGPPPYGQSPPQSMQGMQPYGQSPPQSMQGMSPYGQSPPQSMQGMQPYGQSPPQSMQGMQPYGQSPPQSMQGMPPYGQSPPQSMQGMPPYGQSPPQGMQGLPPYGQPPPQSMQGVPPYGQLSRQSLQPSGSNQSTAAAMPPALIARQAPLQQNASAPEQPLSPASVPSGTLPPDVAVPARGLGLNSSDRAGADILNIVKSIPQKPGAGDYFAGVNKFVEGRVARWASFPVLVHLPQGSPANWQTTLEDAVASWGRYIPVRVAAPSETADIEIAWINHLPPRCLGQTNLEVFNGHVRVTVYLLRPSYYLVNTSDKLLRKAAEHEVGHAIGIFGHSTDPADLMYPLENSAGKAGTKCGGISSRDLNTLRRVYEAPALPSGFQSPHPMGWNFIAK